MRYMTATLLVASLMVLTCYVTSSQAVSANALSSDTNFQEREEINQKYELAPGARVEVSSIRGPVEVYDTNSARLRYKSSVPHERVLISSITKSKSCSPRTGLSCVVYRNPTIVVRTFK